jgi:SOS-response transcriptional repressor LexA
LSEETGIILRRLREHADKSQEELAADIDSSQKLISRHETTGKVGRAWMERYAEYYGVSMDVLAGRAPIPPGYGKPPTTVEELQRRGIEAYERGPVVKLPVVGEIKCGSAGVIEEHLEAMMVIDIDMFPFVIPDLKNWYWLRIRGDSMQGAGYFDGGVALIHKQDTVESGEIAVVMVDAESATLKRVYWHTNMNVVELRPENDNYKSLILPINEVRILGRAKGAFTFS